MFFRRQKPVKVTFDQHLENLRKAGFAVRPQAAGRVLASKYGCASIIEDRGDMPPQVGKAGLLIGDEIAVLVDAGFQKFFKADGGLKAPALAPQLRSLHEFQEDLKETLGLVSLYNESLGTTSTDHLYDRVKDRDRGSPRRPWENLS